MPNATELKKTIEVAVFLPNGDPKLGPDGKQITRDLAQLARENYKLAKAAGILGAQMFKRNSDELGHRVPELGFVKAAEVVVVSSEAFGKPATEDKMLGRVRGAYRSDTPSQIFNTGGGFVGVNKDGRIEEPAEAAVRHLQRQTGLAIPAPALHDLKLVTNTTSPTRAELKLVGKTDDTIVLGLLPEILHSFVTRSPRTAAQLVAESKLNDQGAGIALIPLGAAEPLARQQEAQVAFHPNAARAPDHVEKALQQRAPLHLSDLITELNHAPRIEGAPLSPPINPLGASIPAVLTKDDLEPRAQTVFVAAALHAGVQMDRSLSREVDDYRKANQVVPATRIAGTGQPQARVASARPSN